MKSKTRSARTILFLFVLISLLSSCKKKEPDPDYVGTWSATDMIISGTDTTQFKDTFTLSKDSYDEIFQIYVQSTSKYTDYLQMLGTLTATSDVLTFTITELGVSSFNGLTGDPTGDITLYKSGTTEFETIFSQISQPRTFSLAYSISGSSLSIKSDNNGDGDYNDSGETVVYTKE